jgi:hypothetical protein
MSAACAAVVSAMQVQVFSNVRFAFILLLLLAELVLSKLTVLFLVQFSFP